VLLQIGTDNQQAYGKDTVRPVTILQLLTATQPHPDADFRISGHELTLCTFVAQIQSIASLSTNTTYKLDDGTGLVECKVWIDLDAQNAESKKGEKPLREGDYVRVYGRLKSFNNKRHLGAHVVRRIEDFNEVAYHLLEATYVHLYLTRGPPESLAGGGGAAAGADGMFVGGAGAAAQDAGAAAMGGRSLPNMSPLAKRVFNQLAASPQNNEGLHVHALASALGMPVNEVFKAGDELLGLGVIYTTVDDETWAVLEY
jgi:replication factor A2